MSWKMKCIKILLDFKMQINHPLQVRRPDQVLINKKKITCHLVEFSVSVDLKVKPKEGEKLNKYLILHKVMMIPIVIGVFWK